MSFFCRDSIKQSNRNKEREKRNDNENVRHLGGNSVKSFSFLKEKLWAKMKQSIFGTKSS